MLVPGALWVSFGVALTSMTCSSAGAPCNTGRWRYTRLWQACGDGKSGKGYGELSRIQ